MTILRTYIPADQCFTICPCNYA